MMLHSKEIYALATYVAVVLVFCQPVFSEPTLTATQTTFIHLENEAFTVQCALTGDESDLTGKRIVWNAPSPQKDGASVPLSGTEDGVSISLDKKPGKLASTLTLTKQPQLDTAKELSIVFYECRVPGTPEQHNFPYEPITARATPQFDPFNFSSTAKKRNEKVNLTCVVSYDNDNYVADFDFSLKWMRNGKILAETKNLKYEVGNITESVSASVTVRSYKDGGDYICVWTLIDESNESHFVSKNVTLELEISPYNSGPNQKEVKKFAGDDVELECDVIGFPIKYEWFLNGDERIESGSRITVSKNILAIDDIDYDDRKTYTCVGTGKNGTVSTSQDITLRVKDPLAPLWPFIGILAEAVIIAVIIIVSERYCKSRSRDEKDGIPLVKDAEPVAGTSDA